MLPHADGRGAPGRGRRPRGTGGYGQDGDHQGSRESDRDAVRGVQLLRRVGLPGDGEVLQGSGGVRRVGVLRRVQPHRPRGALRHRAADSDNHARQGCETGGVRLRGHPPSTASHVQRVHHHEPRLRRSLRAPR